jgi:hypothetical protein
MLFHFFGLYWSTRKKMSEIFYEEIFPKIFVYKNLLKDSDGMLKILKDSEKNPEGSYIFNDWQQWWDFGTYIKTIPKELVMLSTPKPYPERLKKELEYLDNVTDSFYKSTSHYLKHHNLKLYENWKIMGPSFSRYDSHEKSKIDNQELSMVYHTDYVEFESEVPGYKMILTCTMYINDDYEEGEVSFLINDEIVNYKPSKGDILVFPSGNPNLFSGSEKYYHAVKKVKNKDKYLIRCFYQEYFSGSKEWLENEKKYGKEVWEEMEKNRIYKERNTYSIRPESRRNNE